MRLCPECKGTGLNKRLHQRYTTGGHNARSCKRCHGECIIDGVEVEQEKQKGDFMKSIATIAKRKKAQDMAVILRHVPKGYDWGWFSREDARMHLQTVDRKNFNLYKVWLENKGKRVFEPDGPIPSAVLKKLEAEVARKRLHIEGRWTNFIIDQKWLEMRMRGTTITVTAYPNVPGSRFTRTIDLAEQLPGIYDPDYPARPKEKIKPDEVVFSRELPAIEIWPDKDVSLRHHILLPPILWKTNSID